jgi:hypothetical protein
MKRREAFSFLFVVLLALGTVFECPSSQDLDSSLWQAVLVDGDETDPSESKFFLLYSVDQADSLGKAPALRPASSTFSFCRLGTSATPASLANLSLIPRAPPTA